MGLALQIWHGNWSKLLGHTVFMPVVVLQIWHGNWTKLLGHTVSCQSGHASSYSCGSIANMAWILDKTSWTYSIFVSRGDTPVFMPVVVLQIWHGNWTKPLGHTVSLFLEWTRQYLCRWQYCKYGLEMGQDFWDIQYLCFQSGHPSIHAGGNPGNTEGNYTQTTGDTR